MGCTNPHPKQNNTQLQSNVKPIDVAPPAP
jgi:hypothetical protein